MDAQPRRRLARPSRGAEKRGAYKPAFMSLSASRSACFAKAAAAPVAAKAEATAAVPAGRLARDAPVGLLHLLPRDFSMFIAGGVAGAIAKTTTAPLDRLKILLQISSANQDMKAAAAAAKGGAMGAFLEIGRSEGVAGYWRGNVPQVLRVLPYSACQLYAYDYLKKLFKDEKGELSVPRRLAAGAGAAIISTTVTYPLDIIRLRLAVDPNVTSIGQAFTSILAKEGPGAFYKGLVASWAGIAPYSALNFAAFDILKKALPERKDGSTTVAASLLAAAVATGSCYPLDTIRRQMQLKGSTYTSVPDAFVKIVGRDGIGGVYKGFVPNALKNLPNQSIRLSTFDAAKVLLVRAEVAYKEQAKLMKEEEAAAAKASKSKGKK